MSHESGTGAAVYARALFQAAAADAQAVHSELEQLMDATRQDPTVWEHLTAPQASAEDRKRALRKIFAGGQPVTRNFLSLLVDKRRLGLLPYIVAELRELVQVQQKQLDVHITTAVDLPTELQRKLEERLSASTGSTVKLHPTVDPDIIGGLVVQHGDTLIDTSLRGRLDQLRLQLARSRGTSSSNTSS